MTTTTDSTNESLAESCSPPHIRPTKRSPQQNPRPSSSSPSASAAATEAKIQSWTKLAGGETPTSITSSSSSHSLMAANTPTAPPRLNSVVPGILRAKPKYSGVPSPPPRTRTAKTTTATTSVLRFNSSSGSPSTDDDAEEDNDNRDAAPAVRSFVVERSRCRTTTSRRPAGRPSSAAAAAAEIDGYTPRLTTVPPLSTGNAAPAPAKEKDEEPLVFNSLADMMALAGTLPSEIDNKKESPYMVEAELQFSCADPDEFQRQQQQSEVDAVERLASHVNTDDDDDDDEENVMPLQHCDDGDDSVSGDDDLLDLLGGGGDDEESTSTAPPRAFLQLWTSLAQWATPEAVALVQNWRPRSRSPVILHTTTDNYDDVCASRCAGLWSQLPRELAWRALQRPEHDRIAAEQRLADLLRCFQYQRPVTLPSVDLYRALACVLLEMVVVLQDQDDDVVRLPEPCRKLGMTVEEYRYLTQSALINLGDASTAVLDDAMPNSNTTHTNGTGVVEQ